MSELTMGQKIKTLRLKHNLTLEQVGDAVGVGKSTVRKWENGIIANMRRDKIAALADALHTTPAYLMGWEEQTSEPKNNLGAYPNIFPIQTKKFPFLGEIACGQPRFADEERGLYVEAGADIQADFCLRANGDSMINARINDGDIVFIRKCEMVDNGEIAAVIIDDEATLKRVYYYRDKNLLILKAENPKYDDLIYTDDELNCVNILGKAVAFQGDVV